MQVEAKSQFTNVNSASSCCVCVKNPKQAIFIQVLIITVSYNHIIFFAEHEQNRFQGVCEGVVPDQI